MENKGDGLLDKIGEYYHLDDKNHQHDPLGLVKLVIDYIN